MKQSMSAIFFVIFALCMIVVVLHLDPVGDPHLPAYAGLDATEMSTQDIPRLADSAALHYNRKTAQDVGANSVVCALILDYRAYDTLFETAVLFTAAISVLSLLGRDEEENV